MPNKGKKPMSNEINTSSRLDQVKGYLLSYIEQNQLRHGDQLPSETEFAKKIGVSRNTLREAYIELEAEGIIIRQHGIGTFVTQSPTIHDSLNDFFPFNQIIKESGFTPRFQTLSTGFEFGPTDVYQAFSSNQSLQIYCVRRIVHADHQPVIYIQDYINPIVPAEDFEWDVFDGNMIHFLSSSINLPLHHIQSQIRATALNPDICKYLEMEAGTPILSVRSSIFNRENLPIAYSKLYFNSNIVQLNVIRIIREK
jgi:GntR family transcriptional regulator